MTRRLPRTALGPCLKGLTILIRILAGMKERAQTRAVHRDHQSSSEASNLIQLSIRDPLADIFIGQFPMTQGLRAHPVILPFQRVGPLYHALSLTISGVA